MRKAISVLAIVMLAGVALLGTGCGSDDDGSERAVEWNVYPPVGRKWVRLGATVEWCSAEFPQIEDPIIEYEGDRVEIELRVTAEEKKEGQNGCLLELLGLYKTITLNRDLDELVLYDASTDPPEKRWPIEKP